MAHTDSRGLPVSTSSSNAARLYREGVDLLLSAWPGAAETLKRAIEADPDFGLAHAALARVHAVRAEPAEARARIGVAAEIAARSGTPREHSHVATLSFTINGQAKEALESALSHVDRWPRDVIILSLPLGAFGLFAFSGMADHDQARVALCERHASHFDANDWWFLTYRGWLTQRTALSGAAVTWRSGGSNCAEPTPMEPMRCHMQCLRRGQGKMSRR